MLLKRHVLDAVAVGSVSLVFRRWRRPNVKAGGSLRTAIGVLAIDDVAPIAEDAIDEAGAARAGYPSAAALKAELSKTEGQLYRVAVRLVGPDPRVALRADDQLGPSEWRALVDHLAALDGSTPWTARAMALIAAHPGRRAADLAAMLGRDTKVFKAGIRKLKALGLTESLDVGYRLSARGIALRADRRSR